MTNQRSKQLTSSIAIVSVFVLWQAYSIHVGNPTLMPSVLDVAKRLGSLLTEGRTYIVLLTSLGRLALALGLALVLGLCLGLFAGVLPHLEAFLKPIIVSLRTLPVISIIIVVLIIFGNTITLYVISLLMLFPILYQSIKDGVKHTDPLLIDVIRLDCDHTNLDVLTQVYLPLSLPFLRSGLITAVGIGFKVLVIAEYIAQTNVSIGREIYVSRVNLAFSDVFAWTLLLLGFVLIIETIVERLLQPRVE